MSSILSFFRRKKHDAAAAKRTADLFKVKYSHFKALLESNSELLQLITDMEEKLAGDVVFGMSYVRSQSSRVVFHAARMVQSFAGLSGNRYPVLAVRLEEVRRAITAAAGERKGRADCPFVLPYDRIGRDMVDQVGGKNANLGEIASGASLPIPQGFAITTAAFDAFIEANGILDELGRLMMEIASDDPKSIVSVSEDAQSLFLRGEIPETLGRAIIEAFAPLSGRPVAMRSSAIGEDSDLSYAGQYLTMLNVIPERVLDSYKLVLASLFTPRAISYRLHKGIPVEGIAMSVACLTMVEAKSAGVMYSRHPFKPQDENVLVNGVFGLGPYVVDGKVAPDVYRLSRDEPPRLLSVEVADKPKRLAAGPGGRLAEEDVPPDLRRSPCLSEEQARELARCALALERHFRCPQDIEWAVDAGGRLVFLQARPLRVEAAAQGQAAGEPVPGFEVLVAGGDVACPGVGCGPAWPVRSDEDLANFPEGAVLVAGHSSPKFVIVMPKAQAVVTDFGSVTGHMASLAREYGVPALLNAKTATRTLEQGRTVTVDCFSGRVYAGEVPELLKLRRQKEKFMQGTPVFDALRGLADLIVPLNLTDPKSPEFKPENCRTVHDIMRLIHEFSYSEMFQISDLAADRGTFSVKLDAHIPLDLHVIDLGDGLAGAEPGARRVRPEQVTSVPFSKLLEGMLDEAVRHHHPRPVDVRGFFSVMSQQMISSPTEGGQRFGDRSYAIVSDKYLNFSSRVGYHYGVLDAYCGKTVNKNYVNFQFKGGAANETRKNRRVRAIARILESMDFKVEVHGDRVVARFEKYDETETGKRLVSLGRLLQFTRQLDMLMVDEKSVDLVADCFLTGDYQFACLRNGQASS
jgi:pyruvate,water dikinase